MVQEHESGDKRNVQSAGTSPVSAAPRTCLFFSLSPPGCAELLVPSPSVAVGAVLTSSCHYFLSFSPLTTHTFARLHIHSRPYPLLFRLVKMKFSVTLLTTVITAVCIVSAAPLAPRAGTGTKKAMGKTRLDASGAVYCELTNVRSWMLASADQFFQSLRTNRT